MYATTPRTAHRDANTHTKKGTPQFRHTETHMHTYRLTRNVCMHIIIDTFSPMPMGRQLWLWLRLPLLLLLRDTEQGHIDCAVINTHSQTHTHANMHILRRRLDFSQCKNRPPQSANGTCTVYMHFSSLSRSLSLSGSILLC